ncbi:hypothetical protein KBY66_00660 [Synechococcus sp. Tobar12-5m-g]|jgi:hypothetical protein|uniref:hypothetical protein n=1 Tax=unclassified Synechococcus TaxID=2626047 RepID=UPI0020CEA160|nr:MULTISPECIES: hypothetical protein [unclassified Synechococcus]MCP9771146.1 hypothetical protein [Synechococcus sp. Tobar12-5m-g]MCP9872086.1 hypothetical protein [Synechococcus sp. Cruz CV-v-12]
MASIPPGTLKRCDLCQVEIRGMAGGQDQVIFSQGGPGTRAKLWARVCQFVREPQRCLNQDATLRGQGLPEDFYGEPPSLGAFGGGSPPSP